ncbi:hypothetical protein [Rhizobium sp. P44RR-XXIV]|uniref:hypothetical protein n=1 Tax=Rhizobium sp. P44RR-XXIV TaxID=1921145 RepID=UPI0010AAFBC5|nr:hypothetical protein [Rhizobium sp. P44RR-XXIV]TIX90526.1 hypothetical protein BSK43_014745 [Rhizobium sp. P44RR-XXIV]
MTPEIFADSSVALSKFAWRLKRLKPFWQGRRVEFHVKFTQLAISRLPADGSKFRTISNTCLDLIGSASNGKAGQTMVEFNNRTFFSLAALNTAIAELLEELTNRARRMKVALVAITAAKV